MTTDQMNRTTSDAVRDELAALGTRGSTLQRHQRRLRAVALTVSVVALAGATTGAALVIAGLPGETTVTPLGGIVSASGTGTQIVEIGAPPANAGAIVLDITCTNGEGTVSVETISQAGTGGSWVEIDCSLRSTPVHIEDGLMPAGDATTITITADPGTTWTAAAQYASSVTSEWAVNENGETYGVPNVNGVPDLSPAYATNGEIGYIRNADLFNGSDPVFVYESDGATVIGEFHIDKSGDTTSGEVHIG